MTVVEQESSLVANLQTGVVENVHRGGGVVTIGAFVVDGLVGIRVVAYSCQWARRYPSLLETLVVGDPADRWSGKTNRENPMSIENDVERDIVEFLGAHYGLEPDEITDESTLEELGVDSLGVFGIADIVEAKYGVSLDDERIVGVRTLSDFKDLVVLKRAEVACPPAQTWLTARSWGAASA
jgi:acyl carrier protein